MCIVLPRIWHEMMWARSLQGANISWIELQDCVGTGRSQNDASCHDVYDLYCHLGVAPGMDYP